MGHERTINPAAPKPLPKCVHNYIRIPPTLRPSFDTAQSLPAVWSSARNMIDTSVYTAPKYCQFPLRERLDITEVLSPVLENRAGYSNVFCHFFRPYILHTSPMYTQLLHNSEIYKHGSTLRAALLGRAGKIQYLFQGRIQPKKLSYAPLENLEK